MKVKLYLLLWSLLIVLVGACNDNDDPPTTIDRTVLMYIAADNNLSSFAAADLEEAVKGAQSVDLSRNNLLVYYDNKVSAKLIHFKKDKKGNVIQDVVQEYGSRNSVGLTEMKEVFSYAFGNYVADSYGIVFWSHGDGWVSAPNSSRWFGQDGTKYMDISVMSEALSVAPHFEFIFFDACFMQSIEVVYELRAYADYFIGSPTEIPAPGAPYQVVVPAMFAKDDVAKKIASVYYDFHAANYTSTLGADDPWDADGTWVAGVSTSVVVSSKLEQLATKTNEVFTRYAQGGSVSTSGILCYDKRSSKYYYDFDGLIRSLTNGNDEDYDSWNQAYEEAVTYNKTTKTNFSDTARRFDMTGYRGVSIYIPRNSLSTFYKSFQWYKAGGWENAGW